MADHESVLAEVKGLLRNALSLKEKHAVELGRKNRKAMLLRTDGTMKGQGFLGHLPMTGDYEGNVMTELSVGDGRKETLLRNHPYEQSHPLITPNQDPGAIAWLLAGGKLGNNEGSRQVYRRAREHMESQKAKGLPVFAQGFQAPTQARPAPYKQIFNEVDMRVSPYGTPGLLDGLAGQMGLASDDPYQLAAKNEALQQRLKKRNKRSPTGYNNGP